MGIWSLVLHLGNFVWPAFALAALLAPVVVGWRGLLRSRLWRVGALLGLAGLAVLVLGLVWSGRDGRIATYAALVLVDASLACWLWRPGLGSAAVRR